MNVKIKDFGVTEDGYRNYVFHCPGCGYDHPFAVGTSKTNHPLWTWNGSFDKPSFHPSLDCNKSHPESHCHSFVTDGKIIFQGDCWHKLVGQTVELPDWDDTDSDWSMEARLRNARS